MATTKRGIHDDEEQQRARPGRRRKDEPGLLLVVALLWALIVALTLLAWLVADIDPTTLMRDPAATTQQPKYLGLYSSLAVIGWTIAAAIFLGTAYLARAAGLSKRLVASNAVAGAVVTILMLDDLLQLHESVDRHIVTEQVVFGGYLAIAVAWLWLFRAEVVQSAWIHLAAAGAMFALSIAVDVGFAGTEAEWRIVTEDTAKLLAIVSLAVYAATGLRALTRSVLRGAAVPGGAKAPSQ